MRVSVLNRKIIQVMKISSKLKDKYSVITYFSHNKRCIALKQELDKEKIDEKN